MTALLNLTDITKDFGGVRAVDGINLAITPGECVALIGPNGAGKTSLMNIISGLIKPDQGTIALAGKPITHLAAHKRVRQGLGRTFQITATYKRLSVLNNIAVSLAAQRPGLTVRFWSAWPASVKTDAMIWLEKLSLADKADQLAGNLAYGDQKRLDIGMALTSQPKLLLLDEPMAGVSQQDRHGLMSLAKSLVMDQAASNGILFTEHDMAMVFRHADRVLVMNQGQLIANGTPDDIAADKEVQRLYLGQQGGVA